MDAWYNLVSGFLGKHPFLAPLLVFWWQAASHDFLSFLRFTSWSDFQAWDWRRAILTWVQGIASGVLGSTVIAGVATGTAAAVGLIWYLIQ